jgi:hypothetical protein
MGTNQAIARVEDPQDPLIARGARPEVADA